jgi:type III pantothenate kinase
VWFSGRKLTGSLVVPTAGWRAGIPGLPPRVESLGVASVVPAVTGKLVRTLRGRSIRPPIVVGPATETGLAIRYDRRQLGADRICAAAGALARWRTDLVVLDFGTATTVNIVTSDAVFQGGLILPGVGLMLGALAQRTARLSLVAPRVRLSPAQHETEKAIQAGISLLHAGGISYILDRIDRKFGRRFRVVATGGMARYAHRLVPRMDAVDPFLASRGLCEILLMQPSAVGRRLR